MTPTPKLRDEFNPLTPGYDDARLLEMFIDAARLGVMDTFRLMPLDKQAKFLDKKDPRPANAARTALIEASFEGKTEVVAHLLSLKASTGMEDKQGWTALAAAAWKGDTAIIGKLLDAGADINAQDAEKWTPLQDALNGNHPEAALLLLSRGANPLLKNADGMNALEVAMDLKMHAVVPALEAAVIKLHTATIVDTVGHTAREVSAPATAQFRKRS